MRMRIFRLKAEGYIDSESQFEYKHIMNAREAFPLLHNHDFYELFLVTHGRMKHCINDQEGELSRGHLVFIRPNDYHSFSFKGSDCRFLNLAIHAQAIEGMFAYLGRGFDEEPLLMQKFPPRVLLTSRELEEVLGMFDRLNTLPVADKKRLNMELRCILIAVFSRYFIHRSEEEERYPEWLSTLLVKMNRLEYFSRGKQAIRDLACKSDEHISRSFRKYLKQTPTQYVNELRLNYAANQLRFSHRQIADIAFEAGFENQSHFHRQFKSFLKHTPNEFRKINLGQAI
jgi:AraC family cel operon transcriptional repressor